MGSGGVGIGPFFLPYRVTNGRHSAPHLQEDDTARMEMFSASLGNRGAVS